MDPPLNIQEAKTVQFGSPEGTPSSNVNTEVKADSPTSEDFAKIKQKITLTKEPGWRLSSNSKLKMKDLERTRSPGEDQIIDRFQIKSDTSISSNGPLKEFYRAKRKLQHQPKVRFDPNPKLVKEALEVCATLEKISIRERQAEGTDMGKTEPKRKRVITRDESTGKLTCPLDSIGGYIGTSLDHIKLVTFYDEEDSNESVEKSIKSGSSKRRKAQSKSNCAKDQDQSNKSPSSSDSSGSTETN